MQEQLKLTIEELKKSTPSLTEESGYKAKTKQELKLTKAIIRVNQSEAKTPSMQPCFEFEIEFDVEYDTEAPILEWVNCFWSNNQHNNRTLRRVTLESNHAGTKNDGISSRKYVIHKSFIAFYEETFSKNSEENTTSAKMIIRANNEDQEIDLSQTVVQDDDDE